MFWAAKSILSETASSWPNKFTSNSIYSVVFYLRHISVSETLFSETGIGISGQTNSVQFSLVAQSCPDSLRPHGPQHAKPPSLSPTPGVYSNSSPSSRWCHPTILSSVVPFSSCLQSFPASGSFKWVSSSHQVAKVSELQLQHQSFQWTLRTDLL